MSSTMYTAPAPQRLNTMRQRIQTLYRTAGEAVHRDRLLSTAFEELAAALDTLHAAENERVSQFDQWLNERSAFQAEIQRYQDLFIEAPLGYLVTSADGTIRMANAAATRMLRASERRLLGRSLSLFIPDGRRRTFRAELATLARYEQPHEWQLHMQAFDETSLAVESIVAAVRGSDGQVVALRWLLHEVSPHANGADLEAIPAATNMLAPALFQAECAFFADASVAVAQASDRVAMLAQVAQLAVGSVADVCSIVIERAEDRGYMVCVATPTSAGREISSNWLPDTGGVTIGAGWPQAVTVYSPPEVAPLLAEQFAPVNAATTDVIRGLRLARAISAPLELEQGQGVLTLFSANPAAWENAASSSLIAELARRMAMAIERI